MTEERVLDKEKFDKLPEWIKEAWLEAAERRREADRRAARGFAQSWAEWHKDDLEGEAAEPLAFQASD